MYTECVHNTYVRTYVCTYTGGSPVSHSGSCPELHDSLSFAKNVKTICTYEGCVVLYIHTYVPCQQGHMYVSMYVCTYVRTCVFFRSSSFCCLWKASFNKRDRDRQAKRCGKRVWSEPFWPRQAIVISPCTILCAHVAYPFPLPPNYIRLLCHTHHFFFYL